MTGFGNGLWQWTAAASARMRGLRWLAGVWLVAGLLANPAWAGWSGVLAPSSQEAEQVCANQQMDSTLYLDPWSLGTQSITPGHWMNPKRSGTGWGLIYNDDRTSMRAVIYTFAPSGRPIWLATDMVALQTDGTWTADLYRSVRSTVSPYKVTRAKEGKVAIRFFPTDPTWVAIRWGWTELDTLLSQNGNQLECLLNFTRLGPDDPQSTTAGAGETSSTAAQEGPNPVFSGYWNESGDSSNPTSVPGLSMAILQNTLGNESGRFTEIQELVTF